MKADGSIVISAKLETKQLEKDIKDLEKDVYRNIEFEGRVIPVYDDSAKNNDALEERKETLTELEKIEWEIADAEREQEKISKRIQKLSSEAISTYLPANLTGEENLEMSSKALEEFTKKGVRITDTTIQPIVDEKQVEEVKNLKQELEELGTKIKELKDKRLDLLPESATPLQGIYEPIDFSIDEPLQQVKEFEESTRKVKSDVKETNGHLKETKNHIKEADSGVKRISKGLQGIGKTLVKTGFLMLGIRSTMMLFRQSFNRVLEGHPKMQQAMDHIKGAIDYIVSDFMNKLEPYLPTLIEFVDTILNIVMQLGNHLMTSLLPIIKEIIEFLGIALKLAVKLWNVLSNSILGSLKGEKNAWEINVDTEEFSKNAEKFAKNINKSNKEVSKLRKQLAGFDEMNVLNDDGSVNGVGNIGSNIKKIVEETKKGVEDADINLVDVIFGGQENFVHNLREQHPAYALGVDISKKLKEGIDKGLTGTSLGAIAVTTVQNIVDKIKKNGFEKTFFDLVIGGVEENKKKINEIKPYIINFLTGVDTKRQEVVNNFLKTPWITAFFGSDTEIDNKKNKITDTNNKVKTSTDEVAKKSSTDATTVKNSWWTTATEIAKKYSDTGNDGFLGKVKNAMSNISSSAKTNTDTALTEIKNRINKFTAPKPSVKVSMDQASLDAASKKIKDFFNKTFTVTFKGTAGTVTGAVKANAKGAIINLPRLASGGIVNRPGRGVPLANGGAIAGERGAEAVLPLTDSVQMERLGQAIARNIVVNLTNEVKLDGRQLSRYISQLMQDAQFSSNGGVM